MKPNRECQGIKESLWLYSEGRLTPAESDKIVRHLRDCPRCKEEETFCRATVSGLSLLREEEMPASQLGWSHLRAQIEALPASPRKRTNAGFPLPLLMRMSLGVGATCAAVWLAFTLAPKSSVPQTSTPVVVAQNPTPKSQPMAGLPTLNIGEQENRLTSAVAPETKPKNKTQTSKKEETPAKREPQRAEFKPRDAFYRTERRLPKAKTTLARAEPKAEWREPQVQSSSQLFSVDGEAPHTSNAVSRPRANADLPAGYSLTAASHKEPEAW